MEKAPEVSLKAAPETKADAETPRPVQKPKKEKAGFFGRIKGFFGSLFHR
jgi:hypothetical protein